MMRKLLIAAVLCFIACTSFAGVQTQHGRIITLYGGGTDTTAPQLSTVSVNGTAWTFTYSEAVTADTTAELCNDYSVTFTTAGAITLSYSAGDETSVVTCTGSPTVGYGDTVSAGLDYTAASGSIEDMAASPNALGDIDDKSVTNSTPGSDPDFEIYFDYDTSWGDGYTTGGSDEPDSVTLTVVNVTQTDLGGGDYAMLNSTSSSGSMRLPITSKNYFDSANGCIEMVINATPTGTNYLFEARDDSADYFYVEILSDNTVYAIHRHDNGSGTGVSVENDDNTATCTDATDCMIQVCWDATTEHLYTRVCSDGDCDSESWVDENDDQNVTSGFNDSGTPAEPSLVYFGEYNGSITDNITYKSIRLWNSYVKDDL